jgi:DnaK suppressor protein
MDKKKVKLYRENLLSRRAGLVSLVEEAELFSRDYDPEATQDPADMAANTYTKELIFSMSANDRQLLEMIDEAIVRIESGEYGNCVNCEEPVQEKRLEAIPWARYCLKCQDLQERGLLNTDDD